MKVRGKKIPVRLPLPPKQGGAMKAKKGEGRGEELRQPPARDEAGERGRDEGEEGRIQPRARPEEADSRRQKCRHLGV